jgi:hypothetical protein
MPWLSDQPTRSVSVGTIHDVGSEASLYLDRWTKNTTKAPINTNTASAITAYHA